MFSNAPGLRSVEETFLLQRPKQLGRLIRCIDYVDKMALQEVRLKKLPFLGSLSNTPCFPREKLASPISREAFLRGFWGGHPCEKAPKTVGKSATSGPQHGPVTPQPTTGPASIRTRLTAADRAAGAARSPPGGHSRSCSDGADHRGNTPRPACHPAREMRHWRRCRPGPHPAPASR